MCYWFSFIVKNFQNAIHSLKPGALKAIMVSAAWKPPHKILPNDAGCYVEGQRCAVSSLEQSSLSSWLQGQSLYMNLAQGQKGKSFPLSASSTYLHKAKYNLVHI